MGEKENEVPPGKCYCGACGILLNTDDWLEHAKTKEHKKNALKTMQHWADKGERAEEEMTKAIADARRIVGDD